MIKYKKVILAMFVGTITMITAAQQQTSISYIYPAGAQSGTQQTIIIGGQSLRRPQEVYLSGEGVRAEIVRSYKPYRYLDREERWLFLNRVITSIQRQLKNAGMTDDQLATLRKDMLKSQPWRTLNRTDIKIDNEKLPEQSLLMNLEEKSIRDLIHTVHLVLFPREKLQLNRQLAETVVVKVTIDAGAKPGDRTLRLKTKQGITNSVVFQVGTLPETPEREPNDTEANQVPGNQAWLKKIRQPVIHDLPVLLNGTIMPGDVDRFRFRAKKGQRLVIETSARRLVPYLADAVPGWFQAITTLYDGNGKEVAYADDYRINPDPVMFYSVPQDGEYELEVRDSIYRGRQDFIYRISISEGPFITSVFPLGVRKGEKVEADIEGWNLPAKTIRLDGSPGDAWIRKTDLKKGKGVSNEVSYAVDDLPEIREQEPNSTNQNAEKTEMPVIINGRINTHDDHDVYKISAKAGDIIVAEVSARQLASPLDSLVRLIDASGNVIAWNDDYQVKQEHLHVDKVGLMTHHADSYLMAKLPAPGDYFIQISDAQQHGGSEYGYRLRISGQRPDFALRATPSSLYVQPGANIPLCVYALRKDAFAGAIKIQVKNNGSGFTVGASSIIPAGANHTWITVAAPLRSPGVPVDLRLEGIAEINGATVRHSVVAADNVMQAFLWRHLLPTEHPAYVVREQKWPAASMELASYRPLTLRPGGTKNVRIKLKRLNLNRNKLADVVLVAHNAPDGLTIDGGLTQVKNGVAFKLKLAGDTKARGFQGNLIVEAFMERFRKNKDGKQPQKKVRWPIGYLPAIPIKIATQ